MMRGGSTLALALLLANCHGTFAARATTTEAPATAISLTAGGSLQVTGDTAVLRGPDGTTLAANARLVREPDPGGACLADGFVGVEPVGDGFLLRNQLCGGWFLIDETMIFAHDGIGADAGGYAGIDAGVDAGAESGYHLTRFTAAYTDRRTASPDGPPRVLTTADFGRVRFEDLDPDDLYPKLHRDRDTDR